MRHRLLRLALRWGPSVAAFVTAATVALTMGELPVAGDVGPSIPPGNLATHPTAAPAGCALADLSAQAAALTGALAFVERAARPVQAGRAAGQIRALAAAARQAEGGELAGVLDTLAGGLEKYAGGDPAGLAAVQGASARNAALRESYTRICGGTQQ